MRLRTDAALCIDLERTCWDGPPPEGQEPEIIQIGLVDMDFRTLAIGREARFYVRPRTSKVSEYCTALTGITPEIIRQEGRYLPEVMRTIAKDWGAGRKALLSWGDDWSPLARDCSAAGCINPFPRAGLINVGQMVTLLFGTHERLGLAEALSAAGLAPTGRRHDGLNDARDTARLVLHHASELRAIRAPAPSP